MPYLYTKYRGTTISFLRISRTNLFLDRAIVKLPPFHSANNSPLTHHPSTLSPSLDPAKPTNQHLETKARKNGLATLRKEDAYVCRSGTRLVEWRGGWCSSEQVCGWNRYIIVRVQRPPYNVSQPWSEGPLDEGALSSLEGEKGGEKNIFTVACERKGEERRSGRRRVKRSFRKIESRKNGDVIIVLLTHTR